jgi:hypothetical protein
MIRKRTVLILGAGASFECGMPLGPDLKSRVAKAVNFKAHLGRPTDGEPKLSSALNQRYGADANNHRRAGRELAAIIPSFKSIDDALHYLRDRPEIVELGKAAIVNEILGAEFNSLLSAHDGEPDIHRVDAYWLPQFFQLALSGLELKNIGQAFAKVTIINFNYDRVVEHYLFWALQRRAAVTGPNAATLVNELEVIRPYGSVGPLDWQDMSGGIGFGDTNISSEKLFELATSIRTFTEQCEVHLPKQIETVLNSAEVLIVVGFGFHLQNMELIKPLPPASGRSTPPNRRGFVTVKGVDEQNRRLVERELTKSLGVNYLQLTDKTAASLFSDLWISIQHATA